MSTSTILFTRWNTGRINRSTYFLSHLISLVVLYGAGLLIFFVDTAINSEAYAETGSLSVFGALLVIPLVVTYVAYLIQVTTLRFHDLNMTGWNFVLLIVPIIGLWLALLLLFAPSRNVGNRYGHPMVETWRVFPFVEFAPDNSSTQTEHLYDEEDYAIVSSSENSLTDEPADQSPNYGDMQDKW